MSSIGELKKIFVEKLIIENTKNENLLSNPENTSTTIEVYELPNRDSIKISSLKEGVVRADCYTDCLMTNLETIKTDFEKRSKNVNRVLDLGTGRGTIAVAMAKIFDSAKIVAVDINKLACDACEYNFNQNNIEKSKFEVRNGDSIDTLTDNDIFDCVCITLPTTVVPSSYEQIMINDTSILTLLNGGRNGRYYVDKVIKNINKHVSSGGAVYLMIASFIGLDETIELLSLNKFNPSILYKVKRKLKDTGYTQLVSGYIESNLKYKFPMDDNEKYFDMILIKGIKE